MKKNYKCVYTIFVVTLIFIHLSAQAVFALQEEPEKSEAVEVPIIMYHNLSKNQSSLNKFIITPEEFEEDLVYIKEQGYETVVMSDLIAFVDGKKKLPEKPIVLTFDDGDLGVYRYAMPLLKQYDMKAVVSIIGKVTDDYSGQNRTDIKYYPNLTWNQVKEIQDTGLIEIQNHSYNLHRSIGAKKIQGESDEDYSKRLGDDLNTLQQRMLEMAGTMPTTFAYPYGAKSKQSDEVLKQLGFSASLTCYDKVNKITPGEPDTLFDLGRTLRPHGTSSAKVMSRFINARK